MKPLGVVRLMLLLPAASCLSRCRAPIATLSMLLLAASSSAAQTPSGYLSADQVTGASINSGDRSAVVLIHGWTNKYPEELPPNFSMYENEWLTLVQALSGRLAGSGSKLLLFHWENDASTGPGLDWLATFFQVGFNRAATAAANAFANGDRLATQLDQSAPDLRRVTFIAHSAGAWAAYRAADKLLQANPFVVVSFVLLDPFVPGVDPTLSTPLTKARMGSLATAHPSQDRIHRLENYYSIDLITDTDFDWGAGGGTRATSQDFDWRSKDINRRVDYDRSSGNAIYGGHSGPKLFYADTVTTSAGGTVPVGLVWAPYDFTAVGFFRGLPYEAFLLPSITAQPQAPTQPVVVGSSLSLTVSANRASTYQWFGLDPLRWTV